MNAPSGFPRPACIVESAYVGAGRAGWRFSDQRIMYITVWQGIGAVLEVLSGRLPRLASTRPVELSAYRAERKHTSTASPVIAERTTLYSLGGKFAISRTPIVTLGHGNHWNAA